MQDKTNRQPAPAHASLMLGAVLMALCASAHAVESGAPIIPFGVFDFGAAIMPPPTEVPAVGLRSSFYHASQTRDNAGNRSAVATDLSVNSVGVAVIKMTNVSILGAKYGFGAVVPIVDMKLDLGIPTPVGTLNMSGRSSGVGDIQVTPLILQWTAPGLFQLAALQVQAPTGSYDKNRLINPGANHWAFTPAYAVTYITPGGLELSSNFQINFNTRNHATDYRSGIEYQQEFAVGQHIGAFTAGLGGYHYRQLSDDQGSTVTNGNRSQVTALGPALNYFNPRSTLSSVWFHAYKEFGARNRAQGTQVSLRAAFMF